MSISAVSLCISTVYLPQKSYVEEPELLEKTKDDDFTFAVPDFDNDGFEDYEDGEF